uniref:Uncharacterized protein n=1 Tax=Ditylenchus dipsaci TaxID=166011 RepID=A0A915CV20_9BILA
MNYFKVLLPLTSLLDNLFVPKCVDKAFHQQQSFFFCGVHCTAWLKFYIVIAFVFCFAFSETVLEEATYIKAEFYEVGRSFNGIKDLLAEWDQDSYSFQCICWCGGLLIVSVLFVATMGLSKPYCLIPIQIAVFLKFVSFAKIMTKTYVVNMSMAYEMYRDMDTMLANLQHFRNRDVLFTIIDLHPRYEPVIRWAMLLSGMLACLVVECFIERVMQFYGYEKILNKLNRPLLIAYHKYQFEKVVAQRPSPQKARLIRYHRNVNGNFTWAPGMNCSLHTAIGDYSALTAVEMDEHSDDSDSLIQQPVDSNTVLMNIHESISFSDLPKNNGFSGDCHFVHTVGDSDEMNEFSWSNSDVVMILQKLRSKQITFGFVEQFLKQEYNQKKSKTAIYRQMGLIQPLDVFLLDADIIPLQSKFGNKIMAVKEKKRFRVYKKHSEALFVCIDCAHAKEDKRPKPLPFLLKKDNRFFLNNGVHIAHCRLHELNELVARDIDRCAREEVDHNPHMKPQKVRGCLFHHSKAIIRNVGQLGFKAQYEEQGSEFRLLVRMTMALPLLPKDQAAYVWKEELEKAGYTMLYQFLHWLQYKGSVRIIRLTSGQRPRPVNKKYERMNQCLDNLWDEYENSLNNALHDESILPDTLKFLSAASYLLATVEKKEQKAAAKRKSLIQLKKICKRLSVYENLNVAKQSSVPKINATKRNVNWWEIEVPSRSVGFIVYRNKNQQSRVRRELMKFLSDHRKEKWTRWVCPEDEVDDYIELHQSSPSEISAERKNWGCSSELILAARLYDRNFVLYQPDERWKFLNFSAKYESVRTPLVDGRETALLRYRMNHFDVVVENV